MKKLTARLFTMVMVLCALLCMGTAAMAASGETSGEPSSEPAADALVLTDPAWELAANGSYYSLKNVVYCTNVINPTYQYMNIYVPAAYIDGGECNGYTAETAPVIIENNCMGWNSSTPGSANSSYLAEGFVHISCGARSRNAENATGKSPAPVVDQKAAVRMLRLNADVIPGDEEKIISLGSSGGGQMSSILGATGNMDEYYPYLYEIGAAGIELVNGEYVSTIDDDIYASMCYCPIVDLDSADLAYAWTRFDAGETSAMTMFSGEIAFSEFQLALQDDLALAFGEYINGLGIENADGEVLSFDEASGEMDVRSGSYYDQILENMSNALDAWIQSEGYTESASGEMYDSWDAYYASLNDPESWLVQNADGSWSVTDMAGFLNGTELARNKDIPGFDTFYATEEGNAFGTTDEGVHFSANVAAVLEENYDEYAKMQGFGDQDVDVYIEQAADELVAEQTYLLNATHIMLDVANGEQESDIARHWRTRNGTADEHTSFTIAYNLAMSANMAGAESVDYSLVWNMPHGSDEGTSTGTFVQWVHDICGKEAVEAASGEPSGEPSAEPAVAVDSVAGEYNYTEVNAYTLEILWTLVLNEDGSYALTEENMVAGVVTYTGTYTANGNVITCGPMAEDGPPVYDWSNPAGFVVTVSGDGFVPGGEAAAPAAEVALTEYGLPLTGSGDTSMDAYKTYMKAYMDCVPEMQGKEEELFGLIDKETFDLPPVVMAFEDWFQENAMSYDEFVAAGGTYSLESFVLTNPANGDPT